jgi:hypothetical protein
MVASDATERALVAVAQAFLQSPPSVPKADGAGGEASTAGAVRRLDRHLNERGGAGPKDGLRTEGRTGHVVMSATSRLNGPKNWGEQHRGEVQLRRADDAGVAYDASSLFRSYTHGARAHTYIPPKRDEAS